MGRNRRGPVHGGGSNRSHRSTNGIFFSGCTCRSSNIKAPILTGLWSLDFTDPQAQLYTGHIVLSPVLQAFRPNRCSTPTGAPDQIGAPPAFTGAFDIKSLRPVWQVLTDFTVPHYHRDNCVPRTLVLSAVLYGTLTGALRAR
jgi:hypothetical protein